MADDPVAYHMNEVEAFLPTWKKPALIMFGDGDPITRGQDKGGKISECIFETTHHPHCHFTRLNPKRIGPF